MFGTNLLTGFAAGAGVMYFFDATHGNRRRKLIADQFNRLAHQCVRDFDASWRDLSNRTWGTVAQAQGMLTSGDVPDETLVQRVRSMMGRHVRNPSAIEVTATDGHVTLHGPALRADASDLLRAVAGVRGVRTVTDDLDVHETPEDIPSLQTHGTRRRAQSSFDFVGGDWSPSTKLVMGTVGAALLGNCLTARRRDPLTFLLGVAGFGLLARSCAGITHQDSGFGRGFQGVEFHKTTEIHAPIEKVFDFFAHPQNLAMISDKIREVQDHGDGLFTKSIDVAPGVNIHLAERVYCVEENDCFATHSEPSSMIRYEKQMKFESAGDHTRVHLQFCYYPLGGVLAHSAAAAFGLDAKSFFDDLMMRAKTYLETGIPPHDAAKRMQGARQGQRAQPGSQRDAGPNVPPHKETPNMAGVAESDQIGPVQRDLTSDLEPSPSAMRHQI